MATKTLPTLTPGGAAVATDIFAVRESGGTEDKSKTLAQLKSLTTTTANQLSVFASGTVYALTATQAALDFGTTDPTLVITAAGTYRIVYYCVLDYNGATFAAVRTATMKLRRTNNTAADLTGSSIAVKTQIVTTLTGTLVLVSQAVDYSTSNTDDSISIFGALDVVPTAGSLDVSSASILAFRLQQ